MERGVQNCSRCLIQFLKILIIYIVLDYRLKRKYTDALSAWQFESHYSYIPVCISSIYTTIKHLESHLAALYYHFQTGHVSSALDSLRTTVLAHIIDRILRILARLSISHARAPKPLDHKSRHCCGPNKLTDRRSDRQTNRRRDRQTDKRLTDWLTWISDWQLQLAYGRQFWTPLAAFALAFFLRHTKTSEKNILSCQIVDTCLSSSNCCCCCCCYSLPAAVVVNHSISLIVKINSSNFDAPLKTNVKFPTEVINLCSDSRKAWDVSNVFPNSWLSLGNVGEIGK